MDNVEYYTVRVFLSSGESFTSRLTDFNLQPTTNTTGGMQNFSVEFYDKEDTFIVSAVDVTAMKIEEIVYKKE